MSHVIAHDPIQKLCHEKHQFWSEHMIYLFSDCQNFSISYCYSLFQKKRKMDSFIFLESKCKISGWFSDPIRWRIIGPECQNQWRLTPNGRSWCTKSLRFTWKSVYIISKYPLLISLECQLLWLKVTCNNKHKIDKGQWHVIMEEYWSICDSRTLKLGFQAFTQSRNFQLIKDTSYAWGPKMTPLLHFIRYLH